MLQKQVINNIGLVDQLLPYTKLHSGLSKKVKSNFGVSRTIHFEMTAVSEFDLYGKYNIQDSDMDYLNKLH